MGELIRQRDQWTCFLRREVNRNKSGHVRLTESRGKEVLQRENSKPLVIVLFTTANEILVQANIVSSTGMSLATFDMSYVRLSLSEMFTLKCRTKAN